MFERWAAGLSGSPESEAAHTSAGATLAGAITVLNADQTRAPRQAQVFIRLWLGFLVGRVLMAVFFVAVVWTLWGNKAGFAASYLVGALAYLALTIMQRWQVGTANQVQFSQKLVGVCAGMDVLVAVLLHHSDFRVANYYPLLALPLLYVSILGTRLQAMAVSSAVALLLLGEVWLGEQADASAQYLQAAGKGFGAMVAAWSINLLSARLDEANMQVQSSRMAALLQNRINELVMSEMAHGVVVADSKARVLLANPSARALIGCDRFRGDLATTLGHPGLEAFRRFVEQSFVEQRPLKAQIEIYRNQRELRRLLNVNTRLIQNDGDSGSRGTLCVLFLEDSAHVQERVRQEKMALMGRMSAAVAHEIRNPLAAIVQANQLMGEHAADAYQRQMLGIVSQNAQRIAQTVDNVLDVARDPGQQAYATADVLAVVNTTCAEWVRMHGVRVGLRQTGAVEDAPEARRVWFDAEHLRRVLVNLLDNAKLHGGSPSSSRDPQAAAIVVELLWADPSSDARAILRVFNPGPELDPQVTERMFEPFFSSQSRSSGLGLYITRQLCEAYRADIRFLRTVQALMPGGPEVEGNQFELHLRSAPQPSVRDGGLT